MEILHNSPYSFSKEDQKRLKNLAPSLDHLGYFPDEALEVIAKNKHFHLFVPKERGGLDYSILDGVRIIEAYARIDGNLGWIVQIGAGGGVFAAYLEKEVAAGFLGRWDQVIAGSDFVGGKAIPVNGGYQVSGEWKYASGALHATAFTGNCRITKGPDAGKVKAVVVPKVQATVIKDWNAMGMRATDSHAFRIDTVFVTEEHTFVVAPDQLLIENRLLKLPFMLYARSLFTPVLIGAVYHYHALYREYLDQRNYKEGALPVLACNDLEQTWSTSRNVFYELLEEIWKSTETKLVDESSESEFAKLCVGITDDLLKGTDQCHRYTGMEGVRMVTSINVAYRNIKTAAAHFLLSPGSL